MAGKKTGKSTGKSKDLPPKSTAAVKGGRRPIGDYNGTNDNLTLVRVVDVS